MRLRPKDRVLIEAARGCAIADRALRKPGNHTAELGRVELLAIVDRLAPRRAPAAPPCGRDHLYGDQPATCARPRGHRGGCEPAWAIESHRQMLATARTAVVRGAPPGKPRYGAPCGRCWCCYATLQSPERMKRMVPEDRDAQKLGFCSPECQGRGKQCAEP